MHMMHVKMHNRMQWADYKKLRGRIKMRFYDFIIEKEIKESPEEVVEVKSKVFSQIYMGDQLMADDPMTAMELIPMKFLKKL